MLPFHFLSFISSLTSLVGLGSTYVSLKLCLIGMIIRRIENKEEKNRVKIFFFCSCLVDSRVENGRDFGGTHKFSLLPHQNRIIPNRERKMGKTGLDKIAHIWLLLFWLLGINVRLTIPSLFSFFFFLLLGLTRVLDVVLFCFFF